MDKRPWHPFLKVQERSELDILLQNGGLGSYDASQSIELSLEPEGVFRPEPSPGNGLLGKDERLENRSPQAFGNLALGPGREIQGQSGEEKKSQGDIKIPAPSALLRRIRVASHRLSSSAWSGTKEMNQVARTFLYFWKSSRILPAPRTTQVRGSSSTWMGRLVSC